MDILQNLGKIAKRPRKASPHFSFSPLSLLYLQNRDDLWLLTGTNHLRFSLYVTWHLTLLNCSIDFFHPNAETLLRAYMLPVKILKCSSSLIPGNSTKPFLSHKHISCLLQLFMHLTILKCAVFAAIVHYLNKSFEMLLISAFVT